MEELFQLTRWLFRCSSWFEDDILIKNKYLFLDPKRKLKYVNNGLLKIEDLNTLTIMQNKIIITKDIKVSKLAIYNIINKLVYTDIIFSYFDIITSEIKKISNFNNNESNMLFKKENSFYISVLLKYKENNNIKINLNIYYIFNLKKSNKKIKVDFNKFMFQGLYIKNYDLGYLYNDNKYRDNHKLLYELCQLYTNDIGIDYDFILNNKQITIYVSRYKNINEFVNILNNYKIQIIDHNLTYQNGDIYLKFKLNNINYTIKPTCTIYEKTKFICSITNKKLKLDIDLSDIIIYLDKIKNYSNSLVYYDNLVYTHKIDDFPRRTFLHILESVYYNKNNLDILQMPTLEVIKKKDKDMCNICLEKIDTQFYSYCNNEHYYCILCMIQNEYVNKDKTSIPKCPSCRQQAHSIINSHLENNDSEDDSEDGSDDSDYNGSNYNDSDYNGNRDNGEYNNEDEDDDEYDSNYSGEYNNGEYDSNYSGEDGSSDSSSLDEDDFLNFDDEFNE
ncbi:RING finger protein [Hokovirus HKV1]|uniref:RING finger protein n=1 Tax=Hokovirus HKV1 TaxID=1977638 RepID=A0A1V0SFV6_9VIRU|nr:RING finger protein [Hokovirus HKV1]